MNLICKASSTQDLFSMLLSVVAFLMHCIVINAQLINNITETILSGTYIINTSSHIHAIQSLHQCTLLTSPFYTNGNGMQIANNPVHFWTSLQSDFNISISDIDTMYADIDGLNERISNTTRILSNFVICRDDSVDLCLWHKLGPIANNMPMFALQPVRISQQFDVDSIVMALNDTSVDAIMIHISYYRISNNNGSVDLDDRGSASCPFVSVHPMFPNATDYGCVGVARQPMNDEKQHIGIGWFVYDDLDKLLDDVGEPKQWQDMFYEYYFELKLNDDYVFYIGHIGAVCSNQNICDAYLSTYLSTSPTSTSPPYLSTSHTSTSPPEDEEKEKERSNMWKTISIVFIIAFCIVLLVLIGMLMHFCCGKCCGLECGGVVVEEETKTIGGKRYIQTSARDI
eukprot:442462_1